MHSSVGAAETRVAPFKGGLLSARQTQADVTYRFCRADLFLPVPPLCYYLRTQSPFRFKRGSLPIKLRQSKENRRPCRCLSSKVQSFTFNSFIYATWDTKAYKFQKESVKYARKKWICVLFLKNLLWTCIKSYLSYSLKKIFTWLIMWHKLAFSSVLYLFALYLYTRLTCIIGLWFAFRLCRIAWSVQICLDQCGSHAYLTQTHFSFLPPPSFFL